MLQASQHTTVSRRGSQKNAGQIDPLIDPEEEDIDDNKEEDDKDVDWVCCDKLFRLVSPNMW